MNAIDLSILNLKETRRRSEKLWNSLPDNFLNWKPDHEAMSFGEMIRHVWTSTFLLSYDFKKQRLNKRHTYPV